MGLKVVNFSELEWKEWMSQGVRFGAQWAHLADRLGARKLGYGSWIVPPGKARALGPRPERNASV